MFHSMTQTLKNLVVTFYIFKGVSIAEKNLTGIELDTRSAGDYIIL